MDQFQKLASKFNLLKIRLSPIIEYLDSVEELKLIFPR